MHTAEGTIELEALGKEGKGRSGINEFYPSLQGAFSRWEDRALDELELMYLFLAGTYLRLRTEDKRAGGGSVRLWDDLGGSRSVCKHAYRGQRKQSVLGRLHRRHEDTRAERLKKVVLN